MSIFRENIVNKAAEWIGRNEYDGSHKEIIDIYNSHKPLAVGYKMSYTDAWCSTFVSAVSIACGATDIIPTECGCERHIELFKKINSWEENDAYVPKFGDIIFYDWDDNGAGDTKGWADHVGIVKEVSGGKIYVIEGNYDNAVKVRELKVNGKYIRGYGVPKYDESAAEAPKAEKTVDQIAAEVIRGEWGVYPKRKEMLEAAGYNYDEVQKKVNELLAGDPSSATKSEIIEGNIVKLRKGAKTYNGGDLASFVYDREYMVIEVKGDRVVIAYDGIVVAAVNKKDLTIV